MNEITLDLLDWLPYWISITFIIILILLIFLILWGFVMEMKEIINDYRTGVVKEEGYIHPLALNSRWRHTHGSVTQRKRHNESN